MGQLDGKAAIVTGGASGIGAACARILAREGARVLITDLDPAGEALAGEIGGLFLRHDVTDEAGWPGVVHTAEERFGGLHVMVANAGIGVMATIVEMSLADWRRQMAVNVDGVFLSVKHAIPAMARAGGGSIVIMSSVAGLRGSAGLAGYSATKGAVRLFAKSAALECAQAGNRVRVNSVHPGVIDTPIWDKLPMSGNARMPSHSCTTGVDSSSRSSCWRAITSSRLRPPAWTALFSAASAWRVRAPCTPPRWS